MLSLKNCHSLVVLFFLSFLAAVASGCASSRQQVQATESESATISIASVLETTGEVEDNSTPSEKIKTIEFVEEVNLPNVPEPENILGDSQDSFTNLDELVSLALESNPKLSRLEQEAAAAWDKVGYSDALPDPVIGANAFGNPIETAAGSQWANLSLNQMLPWLKRLDAQSQKTIYEAMAFDQIWQAERLKVVAEVKVAYYRLYVLGQQIRINKANQKILQSLIEVATQRVGIGGASQGDVLLGTLELSRLVEQLLIYEQQLASTRARLNQLMNRPVDSVITIPTELQKGKQPGSLEMLRDLALENQPEISAAQLQTHATHWGVEVAALRRMPDFSVNFNWFIIEDNRPVTGIVDVGEDAWSLGASMTVPLWRQKYDSIESEATRKHYAAHSATEEVVRQYDALLLDLIEQARAADEIVSLYEETILPQARQTLRADQQSYGQGKVEFDRVIQDFRNLLTLEFSFHRSLGQLAMALARIEQATGTNLDVGTVDDTR